MSDHRQKNWFARHKVLTVILALVVLGIVGGAAGGSNKSASNNSSGTTASASKTYRFNERADKQSKDVELLPNENGIVDGIKLTVTNVKYATNLGDFDQADSGKTYALVTVTINNTSSSTKPYNEYDFRIQTASGQVLDPTIVAAKTSPLNSGDLVAGGTVSGQIAFEVPIEESHQYLIWKPTLNPDRAIVQLK